MLLRALKKWTSRAREARLEIEPLEARVLFSADLAPLLGQDGLGSPLANGEVRLVQVVAAAPAPIPSTQEPPASDDAAPGQDSAPQPGTTAARPPEQAPAPADADGLELVLVDERADQLAEILQDVSVQASQGRNIQVFVLHADQDGYAQADALIRAATAHGQSLASLHLVGHGDDARMQLGGSLLDDRALAGARSIVASWGLHFTEQGDLLVYGCDFAASGAGQALVQQLASLTGTDVAASTNRTGATALGGDWTLEYASGRIDSASLLTQAQQATYRGVLVLSAQGAETLVNDSTVGDQSLHWARDAVGVDAAGNSVVVYQDAAGADGSGIGVFARRFDAAGSPLGAAFQVNTNSLDDQSSPQVAMNASGAFVITWQSQGQDGSALGVYAQRYDSSGNPQGGEFRVNQTSASDQSNPSIAMDDAGNFVVSWNSIDQDAPGTSGIYLRRFNASGVATTGELLANTTTAFGQDMSSIAMDPASGKFVVTWSDSFADGSVYGVFGQRFDADGSMLGSQFQVNTTSVNSQDFSNVGMNGSGFVVAWTDGQLDGSGSGIFFQRFDLNGNALGAETQANQFTTGAQSGAGVSMRPGGGFIVSWDSDLQDGSSAGAYLRVFDASGNAVTGDIQVNTTTSNAQGNLSVGVGAGGMIVAAWSGEGVGDVDGVFLQRFTDNLAPTISFGEGAKAAAENGGPVLIDILASVSDADASTWNGVQLLVDVPVNGQSYDAITIRDEGSGAGQVGIVGSNVFYGGVQIGSFTGSGAPLTVTFNGNASQASVQAVMRNIQYEATGEDPSTLNRTVRFQVIDSLGAMSNSLTKTITVSADNDIWVTTASDIRDGDTSSITALMANRGVDGQISLAEAISAANNTANGAAPDAVYFNIGGGGLHTINLASALPLIQQSVILDARSQGGWNGVPLIEINGAVPGGIGLDVQASDVSILGFVLHHFNGTAIRVQSGADHVVIQSNYIGTDSTGMAAAGGGNGLQISGSHALLGGTGALQGNLIAGLTNIAVEVLGGANGTLIQGNRIGTNVTGSATLGSGVALTLNNATNTSVGGTTSGSGNQIAASNSQSVWILGGSSGSVFEGNLINVDASGTATIGFGVNFDLSASNGTRIGGVNGGSNVLGSNSTAIITEAGAQGMVFLSNRFVGNATMLIDLNNDGATGNDALDADTGPNDLLNKPVLSTATVTGGQMSVTGIYTGLPNTYIRIGIYAGSTASGSGFGANSTLLGYVDTLTNGAGVANFSGTVAAPATQDHLISAVATRSDASYNSLFESSEFSANITATSLNRVTVAPSISAVGNEIRVNANAVNLQYGPDFNAHNIARGANGTLIYTYFDHTGDGDGIGQFVRLLDANGNPLTGAILVNQTTTGDQSFGAVASDASGNFTVVWVSTQPGAAGVYGRRFDSNGNALGGEFRISSNATGSTLSPSIAMSASGQFVVAWELSQGINSDVHVRRYDAAGNALGADFIANTYTSRLQSYATVTMNNAGAFAVGWNSNDNQDGSGWGVYMQLYDANGMAVGGETRINVTTAGDQQHPNLELTEVQTLIATWSSGPLGAQSVYGRLFNASGTAITGEFQVTGNALDNTFGASLSADSAGNFVVSWTDGSKDGSGNGIYARRFSSGGTALGAAFQVNSTSTGGQDFSRNLLMDNGDLYVAWEGQGTGDADGVFIRQWRAENATSEAGSVISYQVVLNNAPTANVTLSFVLSDPTEAQLSTGTLTFTAANWNQAQTLTLTGLDDTLFDGTIGLTLSMTASSSDSAFNGALMAPRAISNQDNDVLVTTASDLADGDTSSIAALLANRGADGQISLREAVLAANNSANGSLPDHIGFAIGAGTQTITLGSGLLVTDAISIDGTTQPGFGSTPVIQIDGGAGGFDLLILNGASSGGSVVRGLSLTGGNRGLAVLNSSGNQIMGNWIGLLPDGVTARGNVNHGIDIIGGGSNIIGSGNGADRNIIVSNGAYGIALNGSSSNTVQGNYIGTNTGSAATQMGNGSDGIFLLNASNDNRIGGTGVGQGNLIAHNFGQGVEVGGGTGTSVLGNSIRGNQGLGIDLNWDGTAQANDLNDADGGANNGQNFPVLTSVGSYGGNTYVDGYLHALANTVYRIEFFISPTGHASGYGEGTTMVSTLEATSDGSGHLSFSFAYGNSTPIGYAYSATATVKTGASTYGDTSEFSAWVAVAPGNNAPVLTTPGSADFVRGGANVAISTTASVSDADLDALNGSAGDYHGAALTVQRQGGANGNDLFGFLAGNGLSLSGANVMKAGVAIASFDTTSIPGQLNILLTHNNGQTPTSADVDHLLQQITYANNAASPPPSVTLAWTFNDGNAGAQGLGGALIANSTSIVNILMPGVVVSPLNGLVTTEAGGTATFSVVLDAPPAADVTITMSVSLPGEASLSTTLLSFNAGNWNVAQVVTVTGLDDTLVDGNASYTVITSQAVSADSAYSGMVISDVALTNNDDDVFNSVTVTTTADVVDGDTSSIVNLIANQGADGRISLREALLAAQASANAPGGADHILFNIPDALVGGAHSISLGSALPLIDDAVVIDASGEPDATGSPVVVLDGTGAGAAANGLQFAANADTSQVRGLVIQHFGGVGILLDVGADGITLAGNYIGTSVTGNGAAGNAQGIQILSANNLIGGLTPADRNLISGNLGNGIYIAAGSANGNTLRGNYIGVDATGSFGLGNGASGIYIDAGTGTLIGGSAIGAGNLISGNALSGVGLYSVNATGTIIRGNRIGTDAAGNAAVANQVGVAIDGSTGTLLGGAWGSVEANQISGNTLDGVSLYNGANNNTLTGNLIGTNAAGTGALGNSNAGIFLGSGAHHNTIGGATATERNLISGNLGNGLSLNGTDHNLIQANWIGVDLSGTTALGNGLSGIAIHNSDHTQVGGAVGGNGNVVAGNAGGAGIVVTGNSDYSTLQGNWIGLAADGTSLLGNQGGGLQITASHISVGGTANGAGNIIAGHSLSGQSAVWIHGSASQVSLLGNSLYGNDRSIWLDGLADTNDPQDSDIGPNGAQNYPVLASANTTGGKTTVTGAINSTPNTTLRIEIFASPAGHASGYGEGRTLLGSTSVTTDATGSASFIVVFVSPLGNPGDTISATATVDLGGGQWGDTSQFAANLLCTGLPPGVTVSPASGLRTSEAGAGTTFSVRLDTAPTGNVTIPISSADTTEGTISITQLVFTPQNWYLAQNVTVTGVQDFTNDGSQNYSIVLGAITSTDPDYNGLDPADVGMANDEGPNTAPAIGYGAGPFNILEDGHQIFSVAGGNAIVLADADAGSNPVQLTLTSASGSITLASMAGLSLISGANGSSGLVVQGSVAALNAALDGLDFSLPANSSGAAALNLNLNDQGNSGTGGPLVASLVINGTVSPVNDAPTSSAGSVSLPAVAEDAVNPAGVTIASLFSGLFNDALDAGHASMDQFAGVAVRGHVQNNAEGHWQVFAFGSWVDFGGMSDNAALVLAGSDLIRFVPTANFSGAVTGTLSVRLLDNAAGYTPGSLIDVSAVDATASYSSGTVSVSTTVTPVNDAPTGSAQIRTLNESVAGSPSSYTFTATDFGFGDVTDTPANALVGIFVATLPGAGTITLSGTPVSAGQFVSAGQLAAGNLVYTPLVNGNGTGYAAFGFQVQDDGGVALGGIDVDPTVRSFSFDVTPVNTAPWIINNSLSIAEGSAVVLSSAQIDTGDFDHGTGSLTISATGVVHGQFEYVANPGVAITSFLQQEINTGQVRFVHDGSQLAPAYSLSVSDGALGVGPMAATIFYNQINSAPLIGYGAGPQALVEDGALTFSVANSNAITLSDPDAGAAVLQLSLSVAHGSLNLGALAGLSFVSGANGASALVVQGTLADLTNALNGLAYAPTAHFNGADTLLLSLDDLGNSGTGGPLSSALSIDLTVSAVNDAPLLLGGSASLAPILEDAASPSGASVSALFAALFSDPLDAGNVSMNSFAGVAVRAAGQNPAEGFWQYSTNAGASWAAFGALSDAAAVALAAGDLIRFSPAPDFNGSPTGSLSVRLLDTTSVFAPGALIDVSAFTASSGFTSGIVSLTTSVTSVNDAPTLAALSTSLDENPLAAALLGTMGFTDVDSGDTLSVTIAAPTPGSVDAALLSAIAIDAQGRVSIANPAAFDFESATTGWANHSLALNVILTDSHGASASATLQIGLRDLNETPTDLKLAVRLSPNSPTESLGSLIPVDPDSPETFSFALLSDTAQAFSIDPRSGLLSLTPQGQSLINSGQTQSLTVSLTDRGGLQIARTFTVKMPSYFAPQDAGTGSGNTAGTGNTGGGSNVITIITGIDAAAPAPAAASGSAAQAAQAIQARAKTASLQFLSVGERGQSAIGNPGLEENQRDPTPRFLMNAVNGSRPTESQNLGNRSEAGRSAFALAGASDIQGVLAPAITSDEDRGPKGAPLSARPSTPLNRPEIIGQLASMAEPSQDESPRGLVQMIGREPLYVASAIVSAGAVWWVARGMALLTAVLAGAPAWRQVDMLPIVMTNHSEAFGGRSEEDNSEDQETRVTTAFFGDADHDLEEQALGSLFEMPEPLGRG